MGVSGVVSSVTLVNGGQFYQVGDVLSASNTSLGSSGSGFATTVLTIPNTTGTSWLGDNYDPVLLYGSMREAMLFQKQEQDVIKIMKINIKKLYLRLNVLVMDLREVTPTEMVKLNLRLGHDYANCLYTI